MSPAAPEIATFRSTHDDVLRPGGLSRWRDMMGRAVLRLDLTLLGDRPFHSEVASRLLPGVRITFATKAGLRMERLRRHLSDGTDDLALHVCTGGNWIVAHRGCEVSLHRGDAVLVSDAEVASVTCPSPSQVVCIQVARKALAPLMPDLDEHLMRLLPGGSESLNLLLNYVVALGASRPLGSQALRNMAAAHLRDLVAAVLGASGDAAEHAASGGIRTARLQAIKTDIVRHLADPDLSVGTLAARHGVSTRYVQALFENENTTFSGFVLARRLARANRLLADPRQRHRRIGEIAFAVGFGDLSYFNKSFRRKYGITPSDARAHALLE